MIPLKMRFLKCYSESERFSILVKTAESVEDYPLVFRFKNDIDEVWEFIVRDKQEENKTMRDFLEACERDSKTQLLEKQIEREKQAKNKGLSEQQAKEYALNIVKSIPEVLEKGTKGTDSLGRVFVDYGNKRVGLNNEWKNEKLENHWVISSYELYDTEKQALRSTPQAITKEKTFNSLNSVGPNYTTKN